MNAACQLVTTSTTRLAANLIDEQTKQVQLSQRVLLLLARLRFSSSCSFAVVIVFIVAVVAIGMGASAIKVAKTSGKRSSLLPEWTVLCLSHHLCGRPSSSLFEIRRERDELTTPNTNTKSTRRSHDNGRPCSQARQRAYPQTHGSRLASVGAPSL